MERAGARRLGYPVRMRLPRRVALVLALLAAAPARAAEPDALHVDPAVDLSVTAGAAAGALAVRLFEKDLLPPTCRWCAPGRFDAWAHGWSVWTNPAPARSVSDALVVAVPVGAVAALAIPRVAGGEMRRAAEDVLLLAEAYAVAELGTEGAKVSAARLRPDAWDGTGPRGALDSRVSFWSGHTSSTFSAAVAAGTIAKLRGYPEWPWVLGVGVAGAAATGYLRMAGDRHWATDVLAGAAFGSAVGVAVPLLHQDPNARVRLLPAPGGLALRF